MPEEQPDFGIRYINDVMVIEPPREVADRLLITQLGDAWLEAIDRERPMKIVVSFDGVRFFGSEAIGIMIRMAKRVRLYGGEIKLCSMGKLVREIFDICQLVPALFQVYDSTADAIESFED